MTKLVYLPPDFLWPDGVRRTVQRRGVWPYKVSFDKALVDLRGEVQSWRPPSGEAQVGLERARSVADPAAVVRFETRDRRQICAACDRYTSRMPNVRAITLFLQAIRRMERDGCQQLIEQLARGQVFDALPAPARWPWSELGLQKDASRQEIDDAYRARAKERHPDAGGDAAAFTKLRRAYEEAVGLA